MKKIITTMLIAAAAFSLTACGLSPESAAKKKQEIIQKSNISDYEYRIEKLELELKILKSDWRQTDRDEYRNAYRKLERDDDQKYLKKYKDRVEDLEKEINTLERILRER